jgi:transmembrane sensor
MKEKMVARNQQHLTRQLFIKLAASVVLVITAGFLLYQNFLTEQDVRSLSTTLDSKNNVLPDGSDVFMNKNSALVYGYDPVKKIRKTTLTGEAYFKIAENPDRDFIIQVDDLFIKDIGTAFNVRAYPQSDSVSVYVESGEVVIYTETDSLHIRATETGNYRKSLNLFSKTTQNNQNVLAYKTQVLIFDNAQLGEVIEAVNEVYDRKLKLGTKELERCRITVTFKHESIEVIAEVIAETLSLTLEKTNPEIIFNGNGCAK